MIRVVPANQCLGSADKPGAEASLRLVEQRQLVPFLVLFQVGFLYTGLLSIVQQYAGSAVVAPGLEPGRQGS